MPHFRPLPSSAFADISRLLPLSPHHLKDAFPSTVKPSTDHERVPVALADHGAQGTNAGLQLVADQGRYNAVELGEKPNVRKKDVGGVLGEWSCQALSL